jgi:hypothetical protein
MRSLSQKDNHFLNSSFEVFQEKKKGEAIRLLLQLFDRKTAFLKEHLEVACQKD